MNKTFTTFRVYFSNDLHFSFELLHNCRLNLNHQCDTHIKLSCHIRFRHAFSALRCVFYYLPWFADVYGKKVISSKTQCNAENTCRNRMWQLDLNTNLSTTIDQTLNLMVSLKRDSLISHVLVKCDVTDCHRFNWTKKVEQH